MKRKLKNGAAAALVGIAGAVTVLLLLFLIGYILLRGLPELSLEMLTSERSYITDTVGILPNILSTLYIIIVSMVIVLPLGVGAAIYLSEYAKAGRLVRLITFAVDTLTGIPSIIFGLVGMLFFGQILGLKQGILAGGLTLVIMVLPTVIGNTLESLHSVPNSLREGALALGALTDRPLIIYRRYEKLIMDAFHAQGLEPDVFCICDDARGAVLWAKAGLATAILPASMSSLCTGLNIREIDEKALETQILLIWRKGRQLPGAVQDFIGVCTRGKS